VGDRAVLDRPEDLQMAVTILDLMILIDDSLVIGDYRLSIGGWGDALPTSINVRQSTINNESTIKDRRSPMI
jgi:hypothetical protein